MKETKITKFECQICHTVYDTKDGAIICETKHKKLKNIPIKCICYDEDGYPEMNIYNYPNAQYDKEIDSIKLYFNSLYDRCDFIRNYAFHFDEIQYDEDKDIIKIYTTNMDENYEKECVKKIIDYRINMLNEKIKKLKDGIFLTKVRTEYK